MKATRTAATAILLWAAMPACAHRLDEYLQATLISIEKKRVGVEIRLTPGVAVLPIVLAAIDANADGVISEPEQRAYAQRVLRDLSFTFDSSRLRPRLISMKFPAIEEMREGRGEIQLDFVADLPAGSPNRSLTFENHHQRRIGAYLVNCLVPSDPDIRVVAQNRNYTQSVYRLDYAVAGASPAPVWFRLWPGGNGWLAILGLMLALRLVFVSRQRFKDSTLRGRKRVLVSLLPLNGEYALRLGWNSSNCSAISYARDENEVAQFGSSRKIQLHALQT